jgi:hypothetical protein
MFPSLRSTSAAHDRQAWTAPAVHGVRLETARPLVWKGKQEGKPQYLFSAAERQSVLFFKTAAFLFIIIFLQAK